MKGLPNTIYVPTRATVAPSANVAKVVFLGPSANSVVDPTFDIALGGLGWPTATNWAIASGKLEHTASNTANMGDLLTAGAVGDFYYVLFTVSNTTAGSVTPKVGTGAGTARTANGTYAEVIESAASITLVLTPSADFDGRIDDIYAYPLSTDTGAANTRNVIERIDYSYSAAPTGGGLQIADSTGVIHDVDIAAAGADYVDFEDCPFFGTVRKPLVVILKPGAGSVAGALNVTSR